jgi:hypothetical protein
MTFLLNRLLFELYSNFFSFFFRVSFQLGNVIATSRVSLTICYFSNIKHEYHILHFHKGQQIEIKLTNINLD